VDPMDREAIVSALEANLRHIERIVSQLDDARAKTRPTPDRWSPLEHLEHLVVVERGVHKSVAAACGVEPSEHRTRKMDAVIAGAGTVTRPLTAPEMVEPKGRFETVGEALQLFRERRTSTMDLARSLDVAFDAHHAPHPLLGPLDIGQWLLLAATHGERHAGQMKG